MALSDLAKKIKALESVNVKAGWFKDSKYQDGTPVAYVASIQEYGFVGDGNRIPPRPFMRPAEADNKKKWAKYLAKQTTAYLGKDAELDKIYDPVGQMIQQDIEDKIINGDHQPLSRITLLLRKWRDDGRIINKSVVEEARRYLAAHPDAVVSQNADPLRDTGLLLATVSHKTDTK